jgi:hypothetical protein
MTPLYVAVLALTLVTIAVSWVLSRKTLERRWLVLIAPTVGLAAASVLSFANARTVLVELAPDLMAPPASAPGAAPEALAQVLGFEAAAWGLAGFALVVTAVFEGLGRGRGTTGWMVAGAGALAAVGLFAWSGLAWTAALGPSVGLALLALGAGLAVRRDRPEATDVIPLGPGIQLDLPGKEPVALELAGRVVTIGCAGLLGMLAFHLMSARALHRQGVLALLDGSDAALTMAEQAARWPISEVAIALASVVLVAAIVLTKPWRAPERFANTLIVGLMLSTSALIFNVPTAFVRDRIEALAWPGQPRVVDYRVGVLPVRDLPSTPWTPADAVLLYDAGQWFDSSTGIPVELPLQDPDRYRMDGHVAVALDWDSAAMELLASPFGVDKLAMVVDVPHRPRNEGLAVLGRSVLRVHVSSTGEPLPVEFTTEDLAQSCDDPCVISPL